MDDKQFDLQDFQDEFAQPIRDEPNERERLIAAGHRFYFKEIAEANRPAGKEFLVRQIRPAALELLSHGKPIHDLIARIWRRGLELRNVPTLTIDEQVARCAPVMLNRFRWASVELDLLKAAMQAAVPGRAAEKIVTYDGAGATTDRRVITRRQLRTRKPITVTQASWDRQFAGYPIGDPAK